MKRVSLIVVTFALASFLGLVTSANAQEFQASYKQYEVGPIATGGASIFTGTVPDGAKTDIQLAYTAGVFADYMFNKNFGVGLGLGYESRGVFFKAQGSDTPNHKETIGYLSLQPSFKIKSFMLGADINLPLSGTAKHDNGLGVVSSSIGKDSMGTLIDVRASVFLPLVENDKGNLDFLIQAAYCLTDFFGDPGRQFSGIQTSADIVKKSPVPTVQIGFTYLFSPGGPVYEKR
ncbi:MAG: outer membrane beta-barrel protein [Bacteroidetes bacterium]|nr:outer membrane beta-barrel protein [Bacteroidota bacterium]